MSYADSINEEQKAKIQSWADEGDDLSAIQKKLADEMDVNVTYMEVRFLIGDLGIEMPVKEKDSEEEPSDIIDSPEGAEVSKKAAEAGDLAESEVPVPPVADPEPATAGAVKVKMSDVLSPGVLAGGTVTFSDGVQATWGLDQMGRMSLDGTDPEYRPSETDLKSFQMELQKLAQEKGM